MTIARKKKPTSEQLKAPKDPSGTAYPAISESELKGPEPGSTGFAIPIVLTWRTIYRILWPALGITVAALSGGALLYWRSVQHLADHTRHLRVGERVEIETRDRADAKRAQMIQEIRLEQRESAVQTREQLERIDHELRKTRFRLVKEIRGDQ